MFGNVWICLDILNVFGNIRTDSDVKYSEMFRRVQTCSDMFRHVQTCSEMFRHVQICWKMFRQGQTCSDMLKHIRTNFDMLIHIQIGNQNLNVQRCSDKSVS